MGAPQDPRPQEVVSGGLRGWEGSGAMRGLDHPPCGDGWWSVGRWPKGVFIPLWRLKPFKCC